MEFRILGPLEVADDGAVRALPPGKPRALLAVLLLRANEVVPADLVIDQLWGENPPATAGHLVHVYVSQLRKSLGDKGELLATRSPGYQLAVGPEGLDLYRFELRLREAREALDVGDAAGAATLAREALGLWRGPALSDFAYESFAQTAIGRLEELRLAAQELGIESELRMGRSGELVAELEALVREHPLRERLRGQLMTALYRSGRQAEALETYQDLRRRLAEELGLDPGPALQRLEGAILRHDPELRPDAAPAVIEATGQAAERSVLVYSRNLDRLDALIAIGETLVARPGRELILVSVVERPDELGAVTETLHERRAALGIRGAKARAAAFTSPDPGGNVVRLASRYSADLVLADAPDDWPGCELPADLIGLLERTPSDVALLVAGEVVGDPDGPVYVLFGGGEEDWAAVELAAWVAKSTGAALRLVGTAADLDRGRRDASGLLAHASLAIQRVLGVAAEPVLASREVAEVVEVTADGRLIAIGLSPRRRGAEGGSFGADVAARSQSPVFLVRGGIRPGGLAPAESLTRFTWTVAARATA